MVFFMFTFSKRMHLTQEWFLKQHVCVGLEIASDVRLWGPSSIKSPTQAAPCGHACYELSKGTEKKIPEGLVLGHSISHGSWCCGKGGRGQEWPQTGASLRPRVPPETLFGQNLWIQSKKYNRTNISALHWAAKGCKSLLPRPNHFLHTQQIDSTQVERWISEDAPGYS